MQGGAHRRRACQVFTQATSLGVPNSLMRSTKVFFTLCVLHKLYTNVRSFFQTSFKRLVFLCARVLRRGPPASGPRASRASPVAIRTGETRSARSGEERETQQWQRPTGRLEKHRSTTVAATHSPRARADAAPHRRTRLASCAPRPRSRVLVPLVEWTAMAMAHQFETMMNRT